SRASFAGDGRRNESRIFAVHTGQSRPRARGGGGARSEVAGRLFAPTIALSWYTRPDYNRVSWRVTILIRKNGTLASDGSSPLGSGVKPIIFARPGVRTR